MADALDTVKAIAYEQSRSSDDANVLFIEFHLHAERHSQQRHLTTMFSQTVLRCIQIQ